MKFIYIFSIIVLMGKSALNQEILTFNDFVFLQKCSGDKFDSSMQKLGFKLIEHQFDKYWKSETCIYSTLTNQIGFKMRIHRVVDSIFIREKFISIITIVVITDDKSMYDVLLSQCKGENYYLFGTYNYDRVYKDANTIEYRRGAALAKFTTIKKSDDNTLFKISVTKSLK